MEMPPLWNKVRPRRVAKMYDRDHHHRLPGVHVIHNDFLVTGSGGTLTEAIENHDENLKGLLQRTREKGLKPHGDKFKLRLQEAPYIGHLLTAEGLKPDPAKVEALLKNPRPEDVPGVRNGSLA